MIKDLQHFTTSSRRNATQNYSMFKIWSPNFCQRKISTECTQASNHFEGLNSNQLVLLEKKCYQRLYKGTEKLLGQQKTDWESLWLNGKSSQIALLMPCEIRANSAKLRQAAAQWDQKFLIFFYLQFHEIFVVCLFSWRTVRMN